MNSRFIALELLLGRGIIVTVNSLSLKCLISFMQIQFLILKALDIVLYFCEFFLLLFYSGRAKNISNFSKGCLPCRSSRYISWVNSFLAIVQNPDKISKGLFLLFTRYGNSRVTEFDGLDFLRDSSMTLNTVFSI